MSEQSKSDDARPPNRHAGCDQTNIHLLLAYGLHMARLLRPKLSDKRGSGKTTGATRSCLGARPALWTGQAFVKNPTTARTAGNCPRRCGVRIVVMIVPSVQPGSRWTSSPRSRSGLAIVSGKRTIPSPALAARNSTPASSALRQARGETRASSPRSLRRHQTSEPGLALTPAWSASSSGDSGVPYSAA